MMDEEAEKSTLLNSKKEQSSLGKKVGREDEAPHQFSGRSERKVYAFTAIKPPCFQAGHVPAQQEAVLGANIWPRNKIQVSFKRFDSDLEIHKQCKMEIQDGVLRLSLAAAVPLE